MKTITLFFLSLFSTSLFAQRSNKEIEIKKISHYCKKDKYGKLTTRLSNSKNTPDRSYYLDTLGNILKKISLPFTEVNTYHDGKIAETVTLVIGKKEVKPFYKTKYFYNEKSQLIKEIDCDYDTDSVRLKFDYEYDSLGNKIKTLFSPTHFYFRTFDSASRIISLKQIYENQLQWEYVYTYTDTSRVGNFKTYYNDGKDYTKRETEIYKKGNLIQTEERYTSEDGISEMKKIYYSENGLLNKIEFYKSYPSDNIFELEKYTQIKIKTDFRFNQELIQSINGTLLEDN